MYKQLETLEMEGLGEFEGAGEFEQEVEAELTGATLASAVRANRILARQIGWGCIVGGQVRPIDQLRTLLGLGASAGEEDLARAIERWQAARTGRPGDGKLGHRTWSLMALLPAPRFKPFSATVSFGGRRLGVIEKARPYSEQRPAGSAGVEIELGFRITDIEAVRRAGFVDAAGVPQFRWIQVIELRRLFPPGASPTREATVQLFRRRGGGSIIDPTAALLPLDAHPYYWYETLPAGLPAGFHINNYLRRAAQNGLCYDLIFYDRPNIQQANALPGRRAYFNFETALVGVRPGRRNVLLNTVRWGFDIVLRSGNPTLSVSAIRSGPFGGSHAMKRVLSREIGGGHFPGHCFVGKGFARGATCR